MWFHVLACDYDGTLATKGKIAPETLAALQRARESGRRILLITGRQFEDLLAVCAEIDFFDLVVAENGAVLYDPRSQLIEDLIEPPPAQLLERLRQAGVPFSTGRIIVSSLVPHETTILAIIRELGLELQIIFNKEAVMVLPSGISKDSGLLQALRKMGISAHNAIGFGDGENDHAFLRRVGFAVAVANAVPSLAAEADLVTAQPNGTGVREVIDGPLLNDLEEHRSRLWARTIEIGRRDDGTAVAYPVFGANLLITGTPGSGTSTLTGVFVERLVREDYVICLIDPEGDHRTLAERAGILMLSSAAGAAESRAEEIEQLLRHHPTSIAIDLSALDREGRIRATARYLGAIQRRRAETGAPHWVIIDEAHQVFPPGGSPAQDMFDPKWAGVCLVSNEPGLVAPEVLASARHVFTTSISAVTETMTLLKPEDLPGGPLETGEALSIALRDGAPAGVDRFRVTRREAMHERHVKP